MTAFHRFFRFRELLTALNSFSSSFRNYDGRLTVGCLTLTALLPRYWTPDVRPGCDDDEMDPSGFRVPTILPVCLSISNLTACLPMGPLDDDDCVGRTRLTLIVAYSFNLFIILRKLCNQWATPPNLTKISNLPVVYNLTLQFSPLSPMPKVATAPDSNST